MRAFGALLVFFITGSGLAADTSTNSVLPPLEKTAEAPEQQWNLHAQNTDIVQSHPAFRAEYSGPNSLKSDGEVRETISVDFYAGVRLERGPVNVFGARLHAEF